MVDGWRDNSLRVPTSWRQASAGINGWRQTGVGGVQPTRSSALDAGFGIGASSDMPMANIGAENPYASYNNPYSPFAAVSSTPASGSDWLDNTPLGKQIQASVDAAAAANGGTTAAAPAASSGGGKVGDPKGTVPMSLNIAYGRGADWNVINQYDQAINEAAAQWGVDPALIKAAIAVESGGQEIWNGGDLNGRDPETTSWGVLQMQRGYHRDAAAELGYDLDTADGQIGYFAALVSGNAPGFEHIGNTPEERYAAMYPGAGGTPEHVEQYMHDVAVIQDIVHQSGGGAAGHPDAPAPPGSMGAVADIWGGEDVAITQGMGSHEGETYNGDPHIYDYCREMGVDGHCGVDYGIPYGTSLASPISGTVVHVGGPYLEDATGGPGEIRIQADNGDLILLGHVSAAYVQQGQRIEAGDMVGASGQSDSRPESAHLHLEVRVLQPGCAAGDQTPSCYRAADPNTYFSQQSQSRGATTPAGPGVLGTSATQDPGYLPLEPGVYGTQYAGA